MREPLSRTRILDAALGLVEAVRRYRSLFGLLYGSVLVANTGRPGPSPSRTEPIDAWFARTVAEHALPNLSRALPAMSDLDCAPEFAAELDAFINALPRSRRPRPERSAA
jgi:TetR/AcrR family tetracycline transcriptional repressor